MDQNLDKNKKIEVGSLIQKTAVPFSIIGLAKVIIVVAIILTISIFILTSNNQNPAIGYGGLGIALILLVLGIASLARTQKTVSSSTAVQSQKVQLDPGEKLIGYASGIMRSGWRGGFAVLGSGQIKSTENALIVTSKQIYFITVPMEGAGKIVSGTDISTVQWMLSQEKIKTTLEDLINSHNLQGVLDSVTVNSSLPLANIDAVEPNGTLTITFKTKDGQKLVYNFLKKEEYEKAASICAKIS